MSQQGRNQCAHVSSRSCFEAVMFVIGKLELYERFAILLATLIVVVLPKAANWSVRAHGSKLLLGFDFKTRMAFSVLCDRIVLRAK